jgi:hypothetical protein
MVTSLHGGEPFAYVTMQLCNDATMQRCNDATMQQCNNATMQQCNNATMQLFSNFSHRAGFYDGRKLKEFLAIFQNCVKVSAVFTKWIVESVAALQREIWRNDVTLQPFTM